METRNQTILNGRDSAHIGAPPSLSYIPDPSDATINHFQREDSVGGHQSGVAFPPAAVVVGPRACFLLDGAGHECLRETLALRRDTVELKPVQKNFSPPLPYQITLLQALPKGKIIENILQKAAELGVFRIVPLQSERVTAQLDAESAESKLEKWRLTIIEAAKQCGAPWLPQIEAPLSPKTFLARGEKFDLPLIASLQSDSRHPRECFESFHAEHGRLPKSVCIWVGPEGDFTPAEINAAKSAGALPITLGRLVLRSETAAVYCLSVLNYELQFHHAPETRAQ